MDAPLLCRCGYWIIASGLESDMLHFQWTKRALYGSSNSIYNSLPRGNETGECQVEGNESSI